ncbi:MAG: hypothetical protein RSF02_02975 [Bacilli bacterium]
MNNFFSLGKNVLLKEDEIEILKKYNIVVNDSATIDEVLFLIDKFCNEEADLLADEFLELDIIAANLAERKYYMGNK